MRSRIYQQCTVTSPDENLYQGHDVEFPLSNAQVSIMGEQMTLLIPGDRGRMRRVDRFTGTVMPANQDPDAKPLRFVGTSRYLRDIVGCSEDDARVTLVLKEWGSCPNC
jgi:hypothetical protein